MNGPKGNASLILGVFLSVILIASGIPPSFAAETFRNFDGTDYIDIPSSASLQLEEFIVEARFRFTEQPSEWGYLINKASTTAGKTSIDQNYALFLTPFSKIGGGFRADDGSYYYVYSEPVSFASWHTAKLTYDGSKLRLTVDGANVAVKSVDKIPDSSASGPLRIGANAQEPTRMFIGDIDYVKIVDRSNFKVSYYEDFDGNNPPPPPPVITDCSEVPMSQLRGVNFVDPILSRFENDDRVGGPANYVQDSMRYLNSYGFNLVRVPYYWEAYESWPAAFMNEIELIAQTADTYDMCVVFDNHHWFTSSYWDTAIDKPGKPKGFPSFVVADFPSQADYDTTAAPFWDAFLNNAIVIDGENVWDVQAEFMGKIINKVDNYDSVAGYEILNEPHLFNVAQYDSLGNYHTYMAQKIRAISDKKIFIDRETANGFQRNPNLEFKIVPQGIPGIVYSPHLYAVPVAGSGGQTQVNNFKSWAAQWNVEVMVGEFSASNQADMNAFISAWDGAGFGWTYWKWSASTTTAGGELLGNVVYESDNTQRTVYLQYLLNSVDAAYG
jgi:hypothetical protein